MTTSVDGLLPKAREILARAAWKDGCHQQTVDYIRAGVATYDNSTRVKVSAALKAIAEALATRTPALSLGEDVVEVPSALRELYEEYESLPFGEAWQQVRETFNNQSARWVRSLLARAALSAMRPVQEEAKARARTLGDDAVEHMVSRFLAWKLPENFNPDAGISFKAEFNEHTDHPMRHEPMGTNLFNAPQAEAMVRHMLEGLPALTAMRPVQEEGVGEGGPCPKCDDSGYIETSSGGHWTGENMRSRFDLCDCICGQDVLRERQAQPTPTDCLVPPALTQGVAGMDEGESE